MKIRWQTLPRGNSMARGKLNIWLHWNRQGSSREKKNKVLKAEFKHSV